MYEAKAKSYFWALLDIFLVVLVAGVAFVAFPAVKRYGGSFAPARTITVSAEGKTLAAPDIAEMSFSVVSQGKNPDELAENNNQKMSAAAKFVKDEGIAEKDMKTTAYTLSPDYKYDYRIQRNFITGYTLTQTLTIKVRELTKAAKIIAGLTPLGINQIGGVNFTIEDEEQYFEEARGDAFARIERKARSLAAEAGVALGNVVSIAEYQERPLYAASSRTMASVDGAARTAPSIEPGTAEVKLNVSVTYEIR